MQARIQIEVPEEPRRLHGCRLQILKRAHIGATRAHKDACDWHRAAEAAVRHCCAPGSADDMRMTLALENFAAAAWARMQHGDAAYSMHGRIRAVLGHRLVHSMLKKHMVQRVYKQLCTDVASSPHLMHLEEQALAGLHSVDHLEAQPIGIQQAIAITASLHHILVGATLTDAARVAMDPQVEQRSGDVRACDVCGFQPPAAGCPHALGQWSAHDCELMGIPHLSTHELMAPAVEATLTAMRTQHEAMLAELRHELLRFMVARLVGVNLAAIKARLWRPEGRLMQRQRERIRGECA